MDMEPQLVEINFNKGDHLIRSGEEAKRVYIIVNGLVRIYCMDHSGKEYTRAFRCEGELAAPFGEILRGVPSVVNIESMENTTVLSLDHDVLEKLYLKSNSWNTIGRKIAETHFIIKEKREFELILQSAQERYEHFLEDYGHIKDRISQYHIASYLGISPVSLSRILNK
jgi:CRP-like cAMP-binding protein